MKIDKLRYSLTEHREKYFFVCDNLFLLIHPYAKRYNDLINKIMDNIDLMPYIKETIDKTHIEFYKLNYREDVFCKSELLAFIFASIDTDWNVIKGINKYTERTHFWLCNGDIVYDPSLAIVTTKDIYQNYFVSLIEIKNSNIFDYLHNKNNLYKFYNNSFFRSNNPDFSVDFLKNIVNQFNRNISNQCNFDENSINCIKNNFWFDDFIQLRQFFTHKRRYYLNSNNISVHPSIDSNVLEGIRKSTNCISDLMRKEYDLSIDYYNNTLGNCYVLSILLNLFDDSFTLVQGGIPYQKYDSNFSRKDFYQHSWLEKDNFVYDPALRVITSKDLYYTFVFKQDEYSRADTEAILRKIGFNLTHFRDYMNDVQIGNDEALFYRYSTNRIGTCELKAEGEKLIRLVKSIRE